MKQKIATLFGTKSKIVYRAFITSVPARLFGFITIPLVGSASGAYQVSELWALAKAVAIYSTLGFIWALFVEVNFHRVQKLFGVRKC